MITDYYRTWLPLPYYYTKYLLHRSLYPDNIFRNDRIIRFFNKDIELVQHNSSYLFKDMYLVHDHYVIGKKLDNRVKDLTDDDIDFLQRYCK